MSKQIAFLLFCLSLTSVLNAQSDTLKITKKQAVVLGDTIIIPTSDTTLIISDGIEYEVFNNRYLLSHYFYDSIYAAAQKSKITKELYNLLITSKPPSNSEIKNDPKKSEDYFEAYRGKSISEIEFVSVEIFSGSVNDTTITSNSSIIKFCNKMHNDTRDAVVRKHLLFAIGDKVDPYEIADTERVIRSLSYIEDAKVELKIDPNNTENVRAIIVTKDRFPWSGDLDVDSDQGAIFKFTNKNILGTGNEFGVGYWSSFDNTPIHGFDAQYSIRNIHNSFVDGTVFVSDNFLGKSKGISFRRGFISPQIKYLGEATIEHVQPIQDLIFADSIYENNSDVDRKSYDLWGARSFQISSRTNITMALRLNHDNFLERPAVKADSNITFHNHHLLLGALTYSKINFLKTKKIQTFNITEDVPVGFIYSVLIGKDWTEFGVRNYRGLRTSYSMYSGTFGYGLFNLESGSYLLPNQKINKIVKIDMRHFTPLFTLGKADTRIFSRLSFFDGDRLSVPLSQSISGENRLRNINGNELNGNRLLTISSELVMFQPWYFYGFRFATLANVGIGHVRENRIENPYKQTFLSLGAGIRIQNESLVINTFEMRISVFPNPPPEGDVFNLRITLAAPTFFQALNIGKPKIVGLE